jgi:hypothetical protein
LLVACSPTLNVGRWFLSYAADDVVPGPVVDAVEIQKKLKHHSQKTHSHNKGRSLQVKACACLIIKAPLCTEAAFWEL